jgi:hypothetical protein
VEGEKENKAGDITLVEIEDIMRVYCTFLQDDHHETGSVVAVRRVSLSRINTELVDL